MSEVVEYAASIASCRAVYLHVISYNKTAILFYEKNAFHALRKLRNFYYINGQYYDAYLYVFYVNGGRPPCTALYPLYTNHFFRFADINSCLAFDCVESVVCP